MKDPAELDEQSLRVMHSTNRMIRRIHERKEEQRRKDKKTLNITIGVSVLFVLLLSAILIPFNQPNKVTGMVVVEDSVIRCSDTDGKNFRKQGTVKLGDLEIKDKCVEDAAIEYYCEKNSIKAIKHSCNCQEGKCI